MSPQTSPTREEARPLPDREKKRAYLEGFLDHLHKERRKLHDILMDWNARIEQAERELESLGEESR